MDGRQGMLSTSLQFRLIATLSTLIVGLALVGGAFSYAAALDEANELQDDQLRQVAAMFQPGAVPAGLVPAAPPAPSRERDLQMVVRLVGPAQRASQDGDSPRLALVAPLSNGLQSSDADGERWRLYVRSLPDGRQLVVGQRTAARDEIARSSAWHTVLPLLALLPTLLLLVVVVVRHAFEPVAALSRELDRRTEDELSPLPDDKVLEEIKPFTASINRLLSRAQRAMQAQARFIADAAHELRTPLTALSLQAEALDAARVPADIREQIARLWRGMRRMRALLEQMLTHAHLDADPTDLGSTPTSLLAVVRSVLEDQMPLALARQIDLGLVGATCDPWVAGREGQLHAIVRNLLDNALRYSPRGGRVDITLCQERDAAVFEIADEGRGIPEGERERVFDPFYRVPGSTAQGSGLGLSIVKRAADRMGALISLSDAWLSADARGLRVRVRFKTASVRRHGGAAEQARCALINRC